jgi:hypothetical protein
MIQEFLLVFTLYSLKSEKLVGLDTMMSELLL